MESDDEVMMFDSDDDPADDGVEIVGSAVPKSPDTTSSSAPATSSKHIYEHFPTLSGADPSAAAVEIVPDSQTKKRKKAADDIQTNGPEKKKKPNRHKPEGRILKEWEAVLPSLVF